MKIADKIAAAFSRHSARTLANPAKILATRSLTLDRRIAAPAIVACGLSGMIFYVAIAQLSLDTARAERDAKLELVGRLSAGGPGGLQAAADAANPFVPAETATTAAAEVDRLIRAVVIKANGVVLSTQASIDQGHDATARRIEVQAVIEGQLETIQRTLFNLETGAPLIFIDDLALQPAERSSGRKEKAQIPLLQVSLTLSAFWRSGS